MADALVDNRWMADLETPPVGQAAFQLALLWSQVVQVHVAADESDGYVWPWSPSGAYTASSTYRMLCQGRERSATASCTWGTYAPMKCKIFVWLALKHRVWTSDRRFRHGLQ